MEEKYLFNVTVHLMDGETTVAELEMVENKEVLDMIFHLGHVLYKEVWYEIDAYGIEIMADNYTTRSVVHITAEKIVVEKKKPETE